MYLEIENLTKHFGGAAALEDVSLEFPSGQVTTVIGPNGAGKTTLFNAIAGFIIPDTGTVSIFEENAASSAPIQLTGLRSHEIARHGVGVLFQDIRVFGTLSALENVAVGTPRQTGENPFIALFRPGAVLREERANFDAARAHLEFVGLADKAHLWAGNLSFGQQKLVAIARLLAADARILLLDEPTSGIHPDMIDTLLGLIERLAKEHGKAVVMVEHNLNVVRRSGDWVYLMARGRVEVFGKPSEVLRDESIKKNYPTL